MSVFPRLTCHARAGFLVGPGPGWIACAAASPRYKGTSASSGSCAGTCGSTDGGADDEGARLPGGDVVDEPQPATASAVARIVRMGHECVRTAGLVTSGSREVCAAEAVLGEPREGSVGPHLVQRVVDGADQLRWIRIAT
jgi:hypothetical protein